MPGLDRRTRYRHPYGALCPWPIGENAILFWGHAQSHPDVFSRHHVHSASTVCTSSSYSPDLLITGILRQPRSRRLLPEFLPSPHPAHSARLLSTSDRSQDKPHHHLALPDRRPFSTSRNRRPRLFGADTEYGSLWSLSVEEQFYLIWPFFVRKLNRKALDHPVLSITIVALTPILRFGLLYAPTELSAISPIRTWDVMDFFAAGALLALAVRSSHLRSWVARAALSPWILTTGLLSSSA